jgi:hypothetical protein
MVEKMILRVPTKAGLLDRYQDPVDVSIPAPPFDLTIRHNDRDETRPRSAPIRADKLTAIDRKWLRGVARVKS